MFMKFNFGLMISEDCSEKNPLVRFADISRSYQDITAFKENSSTATVAPGETVDIVSNARSLTTDVTSEFTLSFPLATSSTVRMAWDGTGTAPGFRTARALATDATTVVSILRIAPSIMRLSTVSGTPFSTAAVQLGDLLRIERSITGFVSPFSLSNQNTSFPIVGVSVSTIDVQDNGLMAVETGALLGANFATALKVMSTGPVKVGDTVVVAGLVSVSNAGHYPITQVSDTYVEFLAPQAYPQTFTNGAGLIKVYSGLIGFLNVKSNGPLALSIDGGSPFQLGMINQCDGLFIGSVSAYEIQATNNTLRPVNVTFQYASLMG